MVRIARPLLITSALLLLAGCDGTRSALSLGASEPAIAAAPAPLAGGPVHLLQTEGPGPSRTDGRRGVLHLDAQGCFRVGGDAGAVLVWPENAAVDLTEPGVVRIFDRGSGVSVQVGEAVALGGGQASAEDLSLDRPLAPCTGSLWAVNSFAPLDPAA